MTDCVFCKIRDGEIPSERVVETQNAFVVMDIFPEAHGHSLVIPKEHYVKPAEIPKPEFYELMDLVVRVQQAVVKSGLGQGTNLVQNYWPFVPEGNLKVDHVHFHLVPRNPGDALARKRASPEELKQSAGLLRKALE